MISPTPNRLLHEKSPYLLQHAQIPWTGIPGGKRPLTGRKGKTSRSSSPSAIPPATGAMSWPMNPLKTKPWPRFLNETFVCIKVDREERPDIDEIYMTVCQMMTGSGGWPLTIFMTPDRHPFFAATYIPKESRWGRQGLVELIPRLKTIWETRRNEVENAAAQTVAHLMQPRTEKGELRLEEILARTFAELQGQFDDADGGFGNAPKFPMPHQIVFLLRHWQRTGAPDALRMADRTLSAMRQGGIFDHLGYGFHRYSTDRHWLVPHFEKMLYDQALLPLAYTEAFQATSKRISRPDGHRCPRLLPRGPALRRRPILQRDDADVKGEEGGPYLWRRRRSVDAWSAGDCRLSWRSAAVYSPGGTSPIRPETEERGTLSSTSAGHLNERR